MNKSVKSIALALVIAGSIPTTMNSIVQASGSSCANATIEQSCLKDISNKCFQFKNCMVGTLKQPTLTNLNRWLTNNYDLITSNCNLEKTNSNGEKNCNPSTTNCGEGTTASKPAKVTASKPSATNCNTEATPSKPSTTTAKPTTEASKPTTTTTKPTTSTKPSTTPSQSTSNSGQASNINAEASEVIRLVNVERSKNGLAPLKANAELSKVATAKAQDMVNKNYFSHTSPTYGSPFDMMTRFGITYMAAGENIAYGQRSSAEVMNGWMNSSGHRANILNSTYTEIGVGVVKDGNGTPYWVQMFINPGR